jgi:hypothetical protein
MVESLTIPDCKTFWIDERRYFCKTADDIMTDLNTGNYIDRYKKR